MDSGIQTCHPGCRTATAPNTCWLQDANDSTGLWGLRVMGSLGQKNADYWNEYFPFERSCSTERRDFFRLKYFPEVRPTNLPVAEACLLSSATRDMLPDKLDAFYQEVFCMSLKKTPPNNPQARLKITKQNNYAILIDSLAQVLHSLCLPSTKRNGKFLD